VTSLDLGSGAVEEIEDLAILVNNAGTDEFGFFPQTRPCSGSGCSTSNLNG